MKLHIAYFYKDSNIRQIPKLFLSGTKRSLLDNGESKINKLSYLCNVKFIGDEWND